MFYPKKAKIYFEDGFYKKNIENFKTITYPNKRILRAINYEDLFKRIYETYCLHYINLLDDNLVVDCGANVGELYLASLFYNKNINYVGIEPDEKTYECLIKNAGSAKNIFFKTALSNTESSKKFYLDNLGGNSSLEKFDNVTSVTLTTSKLDNIKFNDKITLLKLDAEGHELEVLYGAKETLKKTSYVSVDYGFEKGLDQSSTIVEVNNYLLENNFALYKFSEYRLVGLYKNKKF